MNHCLKRGINYLQDYNHSIFLFRLADFLQNLTKFSSDALVELEVNTRQAGFTKYDRKMTIACRLLDRMDGLI